MSKRGRERRRLEREQAREEARDRARSEDRFSAALPVAALLGLTALAYVNAAPDALVHDDAFFAGRRFALSDVPRFFHENAWAVTGTHANLYRPLLFTSYALEGALFDATPVGQHVTNILLHVLATGLLYGLFCSLLRSRAVGGSTAAASAWTHVRGPAFLSALVFGVHPIHTDAVDSIFNRSAVLASAWAFGALWALWRFENERPRLAWTLAAIGYLGSLLSREHGVVLPALAVLLLFGLREGTVRERIRRVVPALGLLVPLAVYVALRSAALDAPTDAAGTDIAAAAADVPGKALRLVDWLRVAAAPVRMLASGLGMVLWPHPLRASHVGYVPPDLVRALTIHLGALCAVVTLRRRAPGLWLGFAFFYVGLAPDVARYLAGAVQDGAAAAGDVIELDERDVYLASAGVSLLLLVALRALGAGRSAVTVAAPVGALALLLFALTLNRNQDWHSTRALFEAQARVDPDNADVARVLVSESLKAHDSARALALCDRFAARTPEDGRLQVNCGNAYDDAGRFAEAEAAYLRAVEGDPGQHGSVPQANLARLYLRAGRRADADTWSLRAVEAEPNPAARHFRSAQRLMRLYPERRDEMRAELEEALRIQPDYAPARGMLQRLGFSH